MSGPSQMKSYLPPMRLTGARILRAGVFQRRSLAVARGRISKGPLPELDLTGYLVLPGIVDLHVGLSTAPTPAMLPGLERRLTAQGVTTAWLAMPHDKSGGAERALGALAARRGGMGLRAKLVISPDAPGLQPESLRNMEAQGLDSAVFLSVPRAALTRNTGSGLFPRDLCRMAETLDELGILYGSYGDADAETREYYRMLGAELAELPHTRAAAATARAMSDPVLAPAGDLLPGAGLGDAITTTRLLAEGLCDALVSAHGAGHLSEAAWTLAGGSLSRLPAAWDLISRRPAEIMGLTDRGVLDHGKRADLAIMNAETRVIEATIAKGRLTYATGDAARRFRRDAALWPMAAE